MACVGKAQLDGGLVLGATSTQASLELPHGRRLDEDEDHLGIDRADVEPALHVDLEDDRDARAMSRSASDLSVP